MANVPNAKAIIGGLVAAALLPLAVTGCGQTEGCHGGAPSPEAAVTTLLRAAVEADEDLACTVVADVSSDDLGPSLAEIGDFVTQVGGLDNLSVKEATERRTGSEGVVVVRAADSPAAVEFDVVRSGDRYLVTEGDRDPGDDPTSDPNPPAASPTPSATKAA